jgi:murein tripeptide amidase MpaA
MHIDATFDGGNIELEADRGGGEIDLAIRHDTNAEDFRQWFCFTLRGARNQACALRIVNAGRATYPDAFEGYRACASYDGRRWFRVATTYDGEALRIEHTPRADRVTYAYFAPYPWERHERMLRRIRRAPRVDVRAIGQSVEGRAMSVVTVGEPGDGKLVVWITARQHPGETMAEWFAEGLLERLVDEDDDVAQKLLDRAVFHVVPNMCPDGGVHGNLRANAAGTNLNRAWLEPSLEASPEVACVRAAMEETGVDLFLDVHGDERNPYCFLAGCEGNPSYSERIRFLENVFEQSLCAHNADFQDEYGYERDEPGGGDLRTAGNWVGERFDCLSYTLEMPFKDNANAPDEESGWSPERSMHLGASTLEAILDSLDYLRGEVPIASEGESQGESESESESESEGESESQLPPAERVA